MKLTSATRRSIGSGTRMRSRRRASVASRLTTRGSAASFGWSWPWPTSTAYTLSAPRLRSTSVKPPVEAPRSRQMRPRGSIAKASSAAASFTPPRDTQGCGASAAISAFGPDLIRSLRDRRSVDRHEPGRDRRLRLGAAREEAALDEEKIGAPAGHRRLLPRRANSGNRTPYQVLEADLPFGRPRPPRNDHDETLHRRPPRHTRRAGAGAGAGRIGPDL